MEALRWILLLIGALLVAGIYWSGRRRGGDARSEGLVERARSAVAREGRSHQADTRTPGPREPDLDIDDLDAHGFEVEGRPGEVGWTANNAAATSPAERPSEVEWGPSGDAGGEWEHEPPREPEAHREPEAGPAPSEPPASAATETGERVPREPEGAQPSAAAPEPPTADPPADEPEPEPEPAAEATARDRDTGRPNGSDDRLDERVVVLYLVALSGERLVGSRLRAALERNGLRHGAYGIFHAGDSEGGTAYSVANVVEPGTFDRATMDTLTTPGVALFMRVPGAQAAETVFDRMLSTARSMADELDARVLDERHSTLTRQTEQHLRDELRLLDRRTRSGHR